MSINIPELLKAVDRCRAEGEEIDLSGIDLRGSAPRYADLNWTDLRYADLNWASLRGAKLDGADRHRPTK